MIEEKGPWAVVFGNGNTYIESDDFTHDAHLYVRGDFESAEQRAEYAEEIARRLNAFAEIVELRQQLAELRHQLMPDFQPLSRAMKVRVAPRAPRKRDLGKEQGK